MNRNSIILEGCHDCVLKIFAIKEIRQVADCGLAKAKKAIDDCISGNKPRISVASGEDVVLVADRLAELGIVVRIGDRIVDRQEHADMAHSYHENEVGTVKITEISHGQGRDSFTVVGELVGGSVVAGNQLGIPLNSTVVVISQILAAKVSGKLVKLELVAEDDAFAFWEAMNVVDEELPILEAKDETA